MAHSAGNSQNLFYRFVAWQKKANRHEVDIFALYDERYDNVKIAA